MIFKLFLAFISTFGLSDNQYNAALVAKSLTLEDLFTKL